MNWEKQGMGRRGAGKERGGVERCRKNEGIIGFMATSKPETLVPPMFNREDGDMTCQLLKLSTLHSDCTSSVEKKEVTGGMDEFLIYSLFEPGPREPTLLPYTDETNSHDYFLLSTSHVDTLSNSAKRRIKDEYAYSNVIGMTVYNEDYGEIVESMRGVLLRGGRHQLDLTRTVVVIVVDGCDILNQSNPKKTAMTETLYNLGLYDKKSVADMRNYWDKTEKPSDEVCFVFESDVTLEDQNYPKSGCCSQLLWECYPTVRSNLRRATEEEKEVSVRTLFVVKPYNRKKLHSHLWLMYGFGLFINPDFVFLVDIGTEATRGSLADLEVYMRKHSHVGGCCGEIIVKSWSPPEADCVDRLAMVGQWFEYKLGHVFNKPLEDLMGYIGVLPGAFSCYRWSALCANRYQVLGQYFRPFIAPHTLPWKLSNIYHLAEDRIMSEEIIKLRYKRKKLKIRGKEVYSVGTIAKPVGFTLGFVKTAKALTEGAASLIMLIKQRRRWINGSWFAIIKMVLGGTTLSEIKSSGHGYTRKMVLLLEILYLAVVISFTWIAVGAYYLGVMMAFEKMFYEYSQILYNVLRYFYLFNLIMVFIISLSLKPDGCPQVFKYFTIFFSLVSYFMLAAILYFIIMDDFSNSYFRFVFLGIVAIMAIACVLYGEEYIKITLAAFAYVAMLPTYINVLSVYAICQTDDISWGTRGGAASEAQTNLGKSFSALKTWYMLFYVTCNVVFGMGFESIYRSSNDNTNKWNYAAQTTMEILYTVAIGTMVFPFIAMIIYLLFRIIRCCRKKRAKTIEKYRERQMLKKQWHLCQGSALKRSELKDKLRSLVIITDDDLADPRAVNLESREEDAGLIQGNEP